MCKQHVPIVIYDCGGTQTYCQVCGKPLSKWEQNGHSKKHQKEKKENQKLKENNNG